MDFAADTVFGMAIGKAPQYAQTEPSDTCVIYHHPSCQWSMPRITLAFLLTNSALT